MRDRSGVARILAFIAAHPDTSYAEISRIVLPDERQAVGARISQLFKTGRVVRTGTRGSYRYSVGLGPRSSKSERTKSECTAAVPLRSRIARVERVLDRYRDRLAVTEEIVDRIATLPLVDRSSIVIATVDSMPRVERDRLVTRLMNVNSRSDAPSPSSDTVTLTDMTGVMRTLQREDFNRMFQDGRLQRLLTGSWADLDAEIDPNSRSSEEPLCE